MRPAFTRRAHRDEAEGAESVPGDRMRPMNPGTQVSALTALGAAQTVTGSKYLIEHGGRRVLLDAGLFQGLKELRERNWNGLPVSPAELDAVVVSHAHLDHCGYLPRIAKNGYDGVVHTTYDTGRLMSVVLPDSARLLEEEARYANRKGYSKHHPALQLYTEADAKAVMRLFRTVPYGETRRLRKGLTFTFADAGHILGSASARFEVERDGETTSVVFSGDLGRYHQPLNPDPTGGLAADYLVVESTYGNREHGNGDAKAQLAEVVNRTAKRGGHLVIPAFAVGRTQHVQIGRAHV